jgi:hypothetical protein
MKKFIKKSLPTYCYLFIKQFFNLFKGEFYPYRKYTHKKKCIFIHIPKVAGTSILKELMGNKITRDHLTYREFYQADTCLFDNYFKFSFARNPYDRLVSSYEYLKQGGNKTTDLYFRDLFISQYDSFDAFVINYLNSERVHENVLFRPQYLFVYNEKKELMVDFCGRFEKLNDDFGFVCNELKMPNKLAKHNKTKRKHYKDYYSNENVKRKVDLLYKNDFELFGYHFM